MARTETRRPADLRAGDVLVESVMDLFRPAGELTYRQVGRVTTVTYVPRSQWLVRTDTGKHKVYRRSEHALVEVP